MVLRAHASITIYKQKHFYTKPIPVRPTRDRLVDANNMIEERENDQNKLDIDAVPMETDTDGTVNQEPVETDTKEKIIGTFVTKTVGICKHKKSRKARCRLCEASCDNVKELSQHHRTDHDIQFCADCGKGFNTQKP